METRPKVIDCVSYNGEEDIFDLRYNILKEYVDEFVVVEAPITFSFKKKELYFPKIQHKYEKVRYHVIDTNYSEEEIKFATESPSTGGSKVWVNEFLQKESIKKAITHLKDEDIVYISDCDEIWRPQEVGDKVYKLEQIVYAYYLNNRSSEPWAGSFVSKYRNIKDASLNHLRANVKMWLDKPESWNNILRDGGWHFTHMGGIDMIKRKIESYGHQELNTDAFKNSLEDKIKNNKDFFGDIRPYKLWTDESDWPQYLKEHKGKYSQLCL